jgi:sugar (pentulose or hexulose) kinase
MTSLVLGIDLGTSGVRIAVMDPGHLIRFSDSTSYNVGLHRPDDWTRACTTLIAGIPAEQRANIRALAVDGTSGTLLACDLEGRAQGEALLYSEACHGFEQQLQQLVPQGGPASSNSGSLARALQLTELYGPTTLLRHQADWINGWFLGDWTWGEEGNNLRLGWNLERECWPALLTQAPWSQRLPVIRASGEQLGRISERRAKELGLPSDLQIVAGTTDSNAAVLATDPGNDDGITVLGTTLVLKRFTRRPIQGPGVTCHRVGGRWLSGGASNAGAGVLQQFFSNEQLSELSRQIDPDTSSGLRLRPLPRNGERFPVDDPTLQPVLEPRPVSDALYLHGLLEGLTEIEAQGWQTLVDLGAAPPKRVISIGGGARNPQWRRLRERRLGCPVISCHQPPAAGVARLALGALEGRELKGDSKD